MNLRYAALGAALLCATALYGQDPAPQPAKPAPSFDHSLSVRQQVYVLVTSVLTDQNNRLRIVIQPTSGPRDTVQLADPYTLDDLRLLLRPKLFKDDTSKAAKARLATDSMAFEVALRIYYDSAIKFLREQTAPQSKAYQDMRDSLQKRVAGLAAELDKQETSYKLKLNRAVPVYEFAILTRDKSLRDSNTKISLKILKLSQDTVNIINDIKSVNRIIEDIKNRIDFIKITSQKGKEGIENNISNIQRKIFEYKAKSKKYEEILKTITQYNETNNARDSVTIATFFMDEVGSKRIRRQIKLGDYIDDVQAYVEIRLNESIQNIEDYTTELNEEKENLQEYNRDNQNIPQLNREKEYNEKMKSTLETKLSVIIFELIKLNFTKILLQEEIDTFNKEIQKLSGVIDSIKSKESLQKVLFNSVLFEYKESNDSFLLEEYDIVVYQQNYWRNNFKGRLQSTQKRYIFEESLLSPSSALNNYIHSLGEEKYQPYNTNLANLFKEIKRINKNFTLKKHILLSDIIERPNIKFQSIMNDESFQGSVNKNVNQVILEGKTRKISSLFSIRIYSDLLGLSSNQPNGLIQFEADALFYIHSPENNRFYGFNYIRPSFSLTKIENKLRELPLQYQGDRSAPSTIYNADDFVTHAHALDLIQYASANAGFSLNFLRYDSRNARFSFQINSGFRFFITQARDSLRAPVQLGTAMGAPVVRQLLRPENTVNIFSSSWDVDLLTRYNNFRHFGMEANLRMMFFIPMTSYIRTGFGDRLGEPRAAMLSERSLFTQRLIIAPEVTVYYYPTNQNYNGLYFRVQVFNYTSSGFVQYQVGYSARLDSIFKTSNGEK